MKANQNQKQERCVECGEFAIVDFRYDDLFGSGADAIIIENIPAKRCQACGTEYNLPEVSAAIDAICADPNSYTAPQSRRVAQIA
jgi:YgiT-type zinc finger domain-containing protein